MKKPPFIDAIRTETARAQEALAATVYAVAAVRAAIVRAAGEGQEEVRIAPPRPLDLRGTEAAAALVKHLEDSGFRVGWDARLVEADGKAVAAVDLVVDWRVARV